MKRIAILTVSFLAVFINPGFSQHKFALNLGYSYIQKHCGHLGVDYRIDSNSGKNRHGPLNVGAGGYLFRSEGKLSWTPEIHLNKTWKHFLITEISASTRNIKPSVGVTFFNLSHLQFGYSIPIRKGEFRGFSFGLRLLIGKTPFYDEIRVF